MNDGGCLYGAEIKFSAEIFATIIVYNIDFATLKHLIFLRSGARMKYINAEDIFPGKLLKEIQKYILHGGMVYVPKPEGLRKKWGENTGSRKHLNHRNDEIRQKFSVGVTIDQLTEQFYLSYDSIKKIVYSKK